MSVICDRLLVGLSGSIGVHFYNQMLLAMKPSITRELRIIQTPNSARFIDPRVVGATNDCDVWTDPLDQMRGVRTPHCELPLWADLFLVMPATANTLACAAQGNAGTLLTAAILASPRPVGFVPNMSNVMWSAPSTRRNVSQLRDDGHWVLDQDKGAGGAYSLSDSATTSSPTVADIYHFMLGLASASSRADEKGALG